MSNNNPPMDTDTELRRWQDAIRDLCCRLAPSTNIDGAGCDSGDPLDLTLTEIGQMACALQNERDTAIEEAKEAKRHDEQMNVALGKLAPKGTWICEVLENIWRAKDVETASFIAGANCLQIERQGFWTGPRIEEQLAASRAEVERLTDLVAEYKEQTGCPLCRAQSQQVDTSAQDVIDRQQDHGAAIEAAAKTIHRKYCWLPPECRMETEDILRALVATVTNSQQPSEPEGAAFTDLQAECERLKAILGEARTGIAHGLFHEQRSSLVRRIDAALQPASGEEGL